MSAIEMHRPHGLVASPNFSHSAVVPPGATWILVGGQNGVDESGAVVSDDVAEQARRAVTNVQIALEAGGATLGDALSFVVTIVAGADLHDAFAAVAGPLAVGRDAPPLVSVAAVAGLAVPRALVEISAVAAVLRG